MELLEIIEKINDDVLNLIEKKYFLNNLDQEAVEKRWLGFPPTSLEMIQSQEHRLGIELPKSYKEFFLISNGFQHISPFTWNLYPIEKVDWASNIEDKWLLNLLENDPLEMSDIDYLNYGSDQRPEFFRPEYFRKSLKISDWGDACHLYLNPIIQDQDEWEVLFYASWLPGTKRFKSFLEFLDQTHKDNQRLLAEFS